MSDAFISYRRKPSSALAQLIQVILKEHHHLDAYLDTTRADSTRVQFPDRLTNAIRDAPVFICLLGDTTLDSEWVCWEIQQAYTLKKRCIPIFQEGFVPPATTNAAVTYLLRFEAVHIFDIKNIYIEEAVEQIAALVRPPHQTKIIMPLVGAIIMFIGIALLLWLPSRISGPSLPPTVSVPPMVVATSSPPTPIVPIHQLNQTVPSDPPPAFVVVAQATPSPAVIARNADWQPVISQFEGVPMVRVPAGCFLMGSLPAQIEAQVVGGISAYYAERQLPQHPQCISTPFWIDLTEVTQSQFAQWGGVKAEANGFEGAQRPVEQITWFEANAFCRLRGARLPTELEWEYAARGVESLLYPWGNEWDETRAVWGGNSGGQTATVGSRPAGASWVGALDMSGNVWEWVGAWFGDYPYNPADGREAFNNNGAFSARSLRGGSWGNYITEYMLAPNRYADVPQDNGYVRGFRCAHS